TSLTSAPETVSDSRPATSQESIRRLRALPDSNHAGRRRLVRSVPPDDRERTVPLNQVVFRISSTAPAPRLQVSVSADRCNPKYIRNSSAQLPNWKITMSLQGTLHSQPFG